jgi:hypothetical protein
MGKLRPTEVKKLAEGQMVVENQTAESAPHYSLPKNANLTCPSRF